MFHEPAFWLLLLLPVCGLIRLASALYLRPRRRELLSLAQSLVREELTKEDRAWLRHEIDRSRATHLLIASPFVPFAILGALAIAAYEGWKIAATSYDDRVETLETSAERLHSKSIEITVGISLNNSKFWNDPRAKRIRDLVGQIEDWNNPLAMTWIAIWLLAASPLLIATYFISGSIRPFVVNLWAPLREPIISILSDTPLGRASAKA